MDLKNFLKDKAKVVNDSLDRLLPGEGDFPPEVNKAVRYSLFAGGKRLRPILVLSACETVGGAMRRAINTAAAFECIHTYSLIHDDLPALDDDDLRRSKPTCHKVFGEATAILAGDALLTVAFELIAKTPGVDGADLIRVVSELSAAAGSSGMIGGQVVDLESEGKEVSLALLERIHAHKTGALITASIRCGAILGGASERELKKLTDYGRAIGLAFQIADDILDVEGTTEELGKVAGADEARSKATYPALVGLKESKVMAKELVAKAHKSLEGFAGEAEALRAIASYIIERKS